jgi:hypothetical protein
MFIFLFVIESTIIIKGVSIELIGFSGYSIFLLENNSWGILSEESLNV